MSEVDWKPKVGCFLRSRVKSFCIGLQVVDCKLILGHFGTKWGRIGTPNWLPRVLAIFQWLFHSKLKTLLFRKSYPDSSSSAYLPPRLSSKHHSRLNVCLPTWLSGFWPMPIDFVLVKRLWISWFPRLRFCGRSRNLEFTITIFSLLKNSSLCLGE